MEISIDATTDPPTTELLQADDFGGFAVAVAGGEDAAVDTALDALGARADASHVFVEPALIEDLAGERAGDPAWRESLAAMLRFAAEHGWVDAAGRVRAHVEDRRGA